MMATLPGRRCGMPATSVTACRLGPPLRPSASTRCSLFLLWWSTSALRLPFLHHAGPCQPRLFLENMFWPHRRHISPQGAHGRPRHSNYKCGSLAASNAQGTVKAECTADKRQRLLSPTCSPPWRTCCSCWPGGTGGSTRSHGPCSAHPPPPATPGKMNEGQCITALILRCPHKPRVYGCEGGPRLAPPQGQRMHTAHGRADMRRRGRAAHAQHARDVERQARRQK